MPDGTDLLNEKDKTTRSATIFDVARLAGVSHQTVSRVLNDMPNVRASTRDRVQQAITQLRYAPSPAARALVTKRSRLVGLVVTAGVDYGPSSIALHVNEAARRARYSVLTISMLAPDVTEVRQAIESLVRQSVEGIVLVAADRAVVGAGGGITWGSVAASEVAEVATKARAPLSALGAEMPLRWRSDILN